ncbi:amidohydrolase family protein [Desulfosporosinus sp. PR]|uniref:N-acyl-D-amino-acid deacylase family protein n=1 Tax=Candidatus Desulfosporosinus nitrosoreducens TaxID=3401928 RepID=UPI0027F30F25|nr:amidohydrolase family protein [Desulfosporosinus sp. PR]MDQ7095900.1 amidohydrolase family protein [Desulfosporosinus sp. PR]
MNCDLLIVNGFIIDGSGKPGFYADLAISKGKIIAIAPKLECAAGRIIDASGLVVTPGFIDPHVHAELTVLTSGTFEDFLRQGVTTTINGNCGHSITPYSSDNIYRYMTTSGLISPEEEKRYKRSVPAWNSFSSYIDTTKSRGTNVNMGFLLGHGSLRWSVMGKTTARTPNAEEYKELKRLIEEGMEQGALGLSAGLAYTPSKYAATDELIQLAKIAQKYDGIYTSHLRTYLGILEAVKEAIQVGEVTGIRVQVSHLTPTCPEAFAEILSARNRGLEIAVDTIPKSSGHFKRWDRFLQFLLPSSSQTYEPEQNNLQDTASAYKVSRKLLKKMRFKDRLLVFHTADPQMEHRTLQAIADEKRTTVDDLILQLLDNNNPKLTFCQGGLNRWDFPGTPYPDDIAHNPLVMVGSDRIFGNLHDPYDWYELFRKGAFPLYFNLCKQKEIPPEEVIRRVTSFPAQQFRLKGRGLLAKGYAADIAILDLNNFRYPSNEEIDPLNPLTMARGVQYTIVNGNVALDKGIVKEVKAGQLLSRNGAIL